MANRWLCALNVLFTKAIKNNFNEEVTWHSKMAEAPEIPK